MEISTRQCGAQLTGQEALELYEGERLQIRTGTAGDITTVLDIEVPAGKVWNGVAVVDIEETDAE